MLCNDCGIIHVYTFEEKYSSSRPFISFAILDVKVPQIDIIILCLVYSATLVNQNYNLLFTDYIHTSEAPEIMLSTEVSIS